MAERSYWLGFSCFSGIGPGKLAKLLSKFESAQKAWNADADDLIPIVGKALTPQFLDFRERFSIEAYEQKLKKKKVGYLILTDEDYPKLLKEIKKPPFVLYYKGDVGVINAGYVFDKSKTSVIASDSEAIPIKIAASSMTPRNDNIIAIVGTRRITAYGKQVTESLTTDLVVNGFVVVSGLALGVDATAHKTTIENNGKTIAVLGCGVDCCSPEENTALYDRIVESGGVIVSEYPLGTPPTKGSFPSRNRIIAGLSQAVLVTEGAADSGALYTATEAFALGRPVFAVPGPITSSLSKGPHSLIAKGGKLISGSEEILQELRIKKQELRPGTDKTVSSIKGSTKEEQDIIDLLQNESMHFDEIVKRSKIASSKLGGILSVMEMKGFIISLGNGSFGLVQ